MHEDTLAGGGRSFTSKRGRLELWTEAPVLLLRITGHGEADFASYIIDGFNAIVGAPMPKEVFFEMGAMVNYDSPLRTRLTVRFVRDRERFASLHVVARSRLVTMGVAVANLALGGLITVHEGPQTFTTALESVARRSNLSFISTSVLVSSRKASG